MRNKWAKTFFISIVILALLNIILFTLIKVNRYINKQNTIESVNNNLQFLNESVQKETYDKIYKLEGVKDIVEHSLEEDGIYIEFFCNGYGFASNSIYTGFYYISEDKPIGFQAASYKLKSSDDGWKWKQPGGDNWYYTKKIADHWYYYEAGF